MAVVPELHLFLIVFKYIIDLSFCNFDLDSSHSPVVCLRYLNIAYFDALFSSKYFLARCLHFLMVNCIGFDSLQKHFPLDDIAFFSTLTFVAIILSYYYDGVVFSIDSSFCNSLLKFTSVVLTQVK